MAQINTTFGFKDQITQNLSSLNNALTQLNNTLNAMHGQMNTANAAIDKVSESSERAANGVGGISSKLLNFNMATQVFHTVKGAVDSVTASIGEMNAAYTYQMTQENKLETVMRNRMKATQEQIQSVKDYASVLQSNGVIGDEVQLAGAQELATYISDVETLKTLMPVLNDIAVQASPDMNVNGQQMANLATMLGKVMGGSLSGMSRRGWVFTEEEKKQFEQMNELQRAQFLKNYAMDAIGNQNQNAAQSAAGQIIQLNNTFGDLKEEIGKALIPFSQFFSIATMEWKIKWYETIVQALQFVTAHINQVIIILGALGAAAIAVGVYFAILHKAEIAAAIASAAHWLVTHAAIIGTIAVIVLVIAAIGALLVFSSKTFPAIGGFIGGVAGVAKEVGAQIKYYFGAAIEGIVNGFLTMKQKIVNAFLTVFDFLLSGVEKVASAMDSVFGTSMADGIASFRNTLQEMKNEQPQKFSLGWEDNRRGFKNAWAEGQAAGSQVGADLSDKLNRQIDKLTAPFKNLSPKTMADSMGQGIENGFSFDSNGALKTADKSLVDISNDYRELLSKTATRRFNATFKNVAPEIHLGGVVFHENADYDEFIEMLKDGIQSVSGTDLEAS